MDGLPGRPVGGSAGGLDGEPDQHHTEPAHPGRRCAGLLSAICFAAPVWAGATGWAWLLAGALLFHLSFVLDCMDGKIARLKGTGSVFGSWVDFVFDRIRFFGCVMALLVGQWLVTDNSAYLLVAPVVVFFDLLRYLNGAQVAKTRKSMKQTLAAASGETEQLRAEAPGDADPEDEEMADAPAGADAPAPRGLYPRVRNFLLRHRVRPHLFSGIEFEMFLCVLAPATVLVSFFTPLNSLVIPVAVFSVLALAFFEVVLVLRLWKETRRFEVRRRELAAAAPAAAGGES